MKINTIELNKPQLAIVSLLLTLLTSLLFMYPMYTEADTTKDKNCPINDKDCDGYPNTVCNRCSNFDVDMDDNDPSVPSAAGPFL